MCRIHGTECLFPEDSGSSSNSPTILRRDRKSVARTRLAPTLDPLPISPSIVNHGVSAAVVPEASGSEGTTPWAGQGSEEIVDFQPTPLSMDDTEQENTHIVGPANTTDSQVLADYLSTITTDNGGMRMVRPVPGSRSKPVLFSTVQKRPMGVEVNTNQAREKLNIIERFLDPYTEQLIEL